jgi:hypothetical protein
MEPPTCGQIVRRFSAADDNTVVRERLTYISQSDRTLTYTMLAGIADARQYQACLEITESDAGSTLTWHADIDAATSRVAQITAGTKAIFEAGISTLKEAPKRRARKPLVLKTCKTGDIALTGTPHLGLTVAPQGKDNAKMLCLFLHGIRGNRKNWEAQVAALGPLMPMAALDLRGYGDSTLGFSPTQIDDFYDDFLAPWHIFTPTRFCCAD